MTITPSSGPMRPPKSSVVDTMLNVISATKGHWKCLQGHETYRAGDDNKDVEGPIYVPEIVYEGAPYLTERESNKKSYDPKDYYWKHSEEDKRKFMAELGWGSKWKAFSSFISVVKFCQRFKYARSRSPVLRVVPA